MNVRRTALLLLLGLLLVPFALAQKEPAKTDLDRLQGSWGIVKLEADGKAEPEENYKGNKLTIRGERAYLREGKLRPVEFTVKLGEEKKLRTIDLTIALGPRKGQTMQGVYSLEGDRLKLCLVVGGKGRPTELSTRKGDMRELFSFERILLPKLTWKRLTMKTTGVSVEMPIPRREDVVRKQEKADGSITTIYTVRSEPEGISYIVACTQLPAKPKDAKEAAEAVRAYRDTMLKAAKGTKESEKEFKEGMFSGKEISYVLEAGGRARVRIFLTGDLLLSLTAVGLEEAVEARSVDRFWKSFRLAQK